MSPNWPADYPPDTSCSYLIDTQENATIVLYFTSLSVESSKECMYDSVQVRRTGLSNEWFYFSISESHIHLNISVPQIKLFIIVYTISIIFSNRSHVNKLPLVGHNVNMIFM